MGGFLSNLGSAMQGGGSGAGMFGNWQPYTGGEVQLPAVSMAPHSGLLSSIMGDQPQQNASFGGLHAILRTLGLM
jgi:hypothetical protein